MCCWKAAESSVSVTSTSITLSLVTVSRGVQGSYNCGRACDGVCGPNSTVTADEEGDGSPGLRSQGGWEVPSPQFLVLLIIYL